MIPQVVELCSSVFMVWIKICIALVKVGCWDYRFVVTNMIFVHQVLVCNYKAWEVCRLKFGAIGLD